MRIQFTRFRRHDGFSLVELMAVLAILAILTAVAVPNFTSVIEANRARNASIELFSALTLARSEAIKRNTKVKIARADDAEWEDGWTITIVDNGTEIAGHGALPKVVIDTSSDAPDVTFTRTGRIDGTAPDFQVDVSATATGHVRCISLDTMGRPASVKEACS
ncbi:MAG: GspH/FimT family pseudopilin [Hydrogenophaga sp.]